MLPSSISLDMKATNVIRCWKRMPHRMELRGTPVVKVRPKGPTSTRRAADSFQPRRAGGVRSGGLGVQPRHTDTAIATRVCLPAAPQLWGSTPRIYLHGDKLEASHSELRKFGVSEVLYILLHYFLAIPSVFPICCQGNRQRGSGSSESEPTYKKQQLLQH